MAAECSAQVPVVGACAIALTDLDVNGVPTPGAGHRYVSDALVSLAFEWVIDTPGEVKGENACGATLVSYQAPSTLKHGTITITLLTPDPYLSAMLSQGSVLTDGDAIGYASPRLGQLGDNALGVEVWAKRIRDGKLDQDFPYSWWLYPWTTNWRPAGHTHANAIMNAAFTGDAYENLGGWWDGPLNDWPVTSDSAYQFIPTVGPLPEKTCTPATVAVS